MKVKALRLAAYLLIAHFLIFLGFAFLAKGGPNFSFLGTALLLLIGSVTALFTPHKRGWLTVVAYAIVVLGQHAIGLWAALNNPATPMGMKIVALVVLAFIDSFAIAALVLVFKPANFAAFTSPVPSPGAAQNPVAKE